MLPMIAWLVFVLYARISTCVTVYWRWLVYTLPAWLPGCSLGWPGDVHHSHTLCVSAVCQSLSRAAPPPPSPLHSVTVTSLSLSAAAYSQPHKPQPSTACNWLLSFLIVNTFYVSYPSPNYRPYQIVTARIGWLTGYMYTTINKAAQ